MTVPEYFYNNINKKTFEPVDSIYFTQTKTKTFVNVVCVLSYKHFFCRS